MLVVVGGHTRNIGKTSVICSIIRSTRRLAWTAIKITQYGHGVCSNDGEDCACALPDHPYALQQELNATTGTDTSRFLAAGAQRSFWARTAAGNLGEAVPALRRIWESSENAIVESNSILRFVKPDLYLTVLDFGVEDFKDSSRRYLDRADAVVVVSEGTPVWRDVAASLWRNKPAFPVSPPDYFHPDLAGFIAASFSRGRTARSGASPPETIKQPKDWKSAPQSSAKCTIDSMLSTRRRFLSLGALAPFLALAAPEKARRKIRDIRTMTLKGPSRTYVLVKVIADDGAYGIAEAYGTPAIGVKEQILSLKPALVGKDPLEIDTIFTFLGEHTPDLSGTRTDGSAHELMRAASGIEMALWDLAGKVLGVPSSTLLGGRFRERVRVYDHAAPRNLLDKASCREWADKVKADPAGFTAHKFGFPHTSESPDVARDPARDRSNRVLTTRELIDVRTGYENCREAIGWDHDIMVHCHWEYDLRTAIQIAEAIEPIKPMWFEDPLQVEYSEVWPALRAASHVPICTGENLARRQGFKDFIVHQGCDILHPDLRNSGGFLETKRIADMASVYGLPMSTHNTGSQLHTWATCQWAASIRDFLAVETITGQGGWMDQLLLLDGPYIKNGMVTVTGQPGLGVEIDPDVAKAHLAPGELWWGT